MPHVLEERMLIRDILEGIPSPPCAILTPHREPPTTAAGATPDEKPKERAEREPDTRGRERDRDRDRDRDNRDTRDNKDRERDHHHGGSDRKDHRDGDKDRERRR